MSRGTKLIAFVACVGFAQWLALVPAWSLSLTWADGRKDLSTSSARACTLLVNSESRLGALPPEWRLVFVGSTPFNVDADSALVVLSQPGPVNTASVCSVQPPTTTDQVLSNLTTIEFCGSAGTQMTTAALVFRVEPSLQAKIAIVEMGCPEQPARAQRGPEDEVTINGGCDLAYPAVLQSVTQRLETDGRASLVIYGTGLDSVRSIVAIPTPVALTKDRSHSSPLRAFGEADTLEIVGQGQGAMRATLDSPLLSGTTIVLGQGGSGWEAAFQISESQEPLNSEWLATMNPPYPYKPKDFTLIFANGLFHLFYTRNNANQDNYDLTENDLGHAVSSDFMTWNNLPPVMLVRDSNWDNLHIWAPTIQYKDGVYYMFYTGVTRVPYPYNLYQRIGVATSTDLMNPNWVRYDAPVWDGNRTPWAFADSSAWQGCQFRDPFVMQDPLDAQSWLMYFVATPNVAHNELIAGAARNSTGLSQWENLAPLFNTDTTRSATTRGIESPHAFVRNDKMYLFYTTRSVNPIQFQYTTDQIVQASSWRGPYLLFDNDVDSNVLFASEYFRYGSHEYLAAVNGWNYGIQIRELAWTTDSTFSVGMPSVAGVGPALARGEMSVKVGCARDGRTFRVICWSPTSSQARLEALDIEGRHVATLGLGELAQGANAIEWNGRSCSGARLPAGVYFMRLQSQGSTATAKFVVLQ